LNEQVQKDMGQYFYTDGKLTSRKETVYSEFFDLTIFLRGLL